MNFLIILMAFIGICVVTAFLIMLLWKYCVSISNGIQIYELCGDEYEAVMRIYESHMHVKRHYEKLELERG